jgi:tetratricopeptide (TPR) repeat protein
MEDTAPGIPRGTQVISRPLQAMIAAALEHHRQGRLAEAQQIYRRILVLDPNHADALHLLGVVAYQSGRHDEARALIGRAIALHPGAASYHSNLGNVLQVQDRLEEAAASYRRALALNANLPEVHLNLGNVVQELGGVDESLVCYERALALKPDLPEARISRSLTLLLRGDFATGWVDSEWRWRAKDFDTAPRPYPQPLWKGERLDLGRLLIWGEQGIGDEIMFAGLIQDVMRTGNELVLLCDARLSALFARSFPNILVISTYDPEKHADLEVAAHLPSGSLPAIFRTSLAHFGATCSPYLMADPNERDRFREKYGERRKIGLAWHTRNQKSGRKRSMELETFAPLFAATDAQWISLQYGDHDELARQAQAACAPVLIDGSVDQLTDIDRFAAQVAAMDLVITIDNSTAHLAAALGVPTWLLLPFAPNWRWMLERGDSPWYPTMRLYRQPELGDWAAVIREVRKSLRSWV